MKKNNARIKDYGDKPAYVGNTMNVLKQNLAKRRRRPGVGKYQTVIFKRDAALIDDEIGEQAQIALVKRSRPTVETLIKAIDKLLVSGHIRLINAGCGASIAPSTKNL